MKTGYLIVLSLALLLTTITATTLDADTPPLAKAPFDATQAKKFQQQWAGQLGKPLVHTNSIGMKLTLIPPGEFTMGRTE